MLAVALVLAVLAAVLHVAIFTMEAVLFSARPDVQERFRTPPADVAAVRSWALNQGFYNLFLAVGALVGAGLAAAGRHDVGLALVLTTCGSMAAAAVVLVLSDRRMARAALLQGVLPLLAVVFSVAVLVR